MNLLVTIEDIKNELDIDLQVTLGKQPQYVNKWIGRQQETVLNHIASYRYGGRSDVNRLLESGEVVSVVRKAIIEQIDYLAENNFVQPQQAMTADYSSLPHVAPLAHQILENAGLLYSGAWGQ